jgi:EAL domain-containing protein (putative c-di-GMP-specific phosphodiesterase class I)
MSSTSPVGRDRDDAKKRRPGKGAQKKPARSRPAGQAADDSILVVDKTGKPTPLNRGFRRRWKIPQAGKTLPLNQRFSRMWQVPHTLLDRLALENSLRHALDRGELAVYLQPQAKVDTDEIVGMEALARWHHPDRGLIPPAEFIPLAEETGAIVQLGEWVLQAACALSKAQQEAGFPPLRTAVNLSAHQFQQPDLLEMVGGVLEDTRLDPKWLELEITEGTAVENADSAITVLRGLRHMGVRISLDDFGTGYSSLAYLKDLPIDTVKIDRSLVHDVNRKRDHAAIATAIIAMAGSLRLDVVAEGVETQDQLAFLKEQRCDKYQGFLLAKPMPSEVFEAMLSRHGPSQQEPLQRAS